MNKLFKYLMVLISGTLFNGSLFSQEDSLSFYLEQAALNNPGLKASYLEYSASLEKVPQAASLPDPQLQMGFFLKPMQLPGGNQVSDMKVMQMFPWFGTLEAARDEASIMAAAKFQSFINSRNWLYFNVKSSYYKVYQTGKEIEKAERNLDLLRTLEKIALARFSVANSASARTQGNTMGTMTGKENKGSMVDLLRVQIEINSLDNRIAQLKDQHITDKVSFNRLLNRESSSEVFIPDTLKIILPPEDIISLIDSLPYHSMVRMYQAEAEANAARKTMVTRMGYPMIGVGLDYMIINKREGNTAMMNGNDMLMPMVSLSLPIYRKKYRAMSNEAEYLKQAAQEYAEDAINTLRVDFTRAIQNLNDARRRISLYRNQSQLADRSIQLLITSYSSNGADLEEIIRMQQMLLEYEFSLIDAQVDLNTSIAKLNYLTAH